MKWVLTDKPNAIASGTAGDGVVHALCGGGWVTDGLYFVGRTQCGVEGKGYVWLKPTNKRVTCEVCKELLKRRKNRKHSCYSLLRKESGK